MKKDTEYISNLFRKSNWDEVSISKNILYNINLDLSFCNDYAVVGLVLEDDIQKIVNNWSECQIQMADLRENQIVGSKKDLYLIFIVKQIHLAEIDKLQLMLNDTRVCRKICIERNDLSIEATLMQVPFLKFSTQINEQLVIDNCTNIDLSLKGLSSVILNDLTNCSKEKIVENILQDKYAEVKSN